MPLESPQEVDQLYGEIIHFTDALHLPHDGNVVATLSQLTEECEKIRNNIPKDIQLRAHINNKKVNFEAIQMRMKYLLSRYFVLTRKLDIFASDFFQSQRHPNRIYRVDYFQEKDTENSNFPNVKGNILLQNLRNIVNDRSEIETERSNALMVSDEVVKILMEFSSIEQKLEDMYREMV